MMPEINRRRFITGTSAALLSAIPLIGAEIVADPCRYWPSCPKLVYGKTESNAWCRGCRR